MRLWEYGKEFTETLNKENFNLPVFDLSMPDLWQKPQMTSFGTTGSIHIWLI